MFQLDQQEPSEMPEWASYLIQLGSWVAERSKRAQGRMTVAVSLPRLEYSALLVSMGVLTQGVEAVPQMSAAARWKMLIGRNVRFDEKGLKRVGKLEEVTDDPPALKILVRHTQEKDLTDLSIAERMRYSYPKTTHERVLLPVAQWDTVKPLSKEINLSRQRSAQQNAKDEASVESYNKLSSLFGPTNADKLISSNAFLCTVVAEKSRLQDELELRLRSSIGTEAAKLHEYLRPSMMGQYQTSPLVQIVSTIEKADLMPGVPLIAEANRSLPDLLAATVANDRIILLGRNAPSFVTSSDSIYKSFAVRKGKEIDLLMNCTSIDSLCFEH
jgi:hypothetical protein